MVQQQSTRQMKTGQAALHQLPQTGRSALYLAAEGEQISWRPLMASDSGHREPAAQVAPQLSQALPLLLSMQSVALLLLMLLMVS